MSNLANAIKEKLNGVKITGTISLRDECKKIGYDYWKSLEVSNAIDELDSFYNI